MQVSALENYSLELVHMTFGGVWCISCLHPNIEAEQETFESRTAQGMAHCFLNVNESCRTIWTLDVGTHKIEANVFARLWSEEIDKMKKN